MNILILGSDGQLGMSYKKISSEFGFNLNFKNKKQVDITKPKLSIFKDVDFIINCAAYTNVDGAENDEKLAFNINSSSLHKLSEISNKFQAPLIHYSTDYLFNEIIENPISEKYIPNPQSVYAKSKLSGEEVLSENCDKYLIIRTSWVYSEYGKNFLKTIIEKGLKGDDLKVINDQIGSPTYAPDISRVTLSLLNVKKKDSFGKNLYHFSGDTHISWYEFALKIKKEIEKKGISFSSITPIRTKDYVSKIMAQRPYYSALDSSKVMSEYNVKASDFRNGIKNSINCFLSNHKS
tara:strand:+ start:1731 stop:2609 length:879 start_codon:yes stop_codon:yes gene_type:complete